MQVIKNSHVALLLMFFALLALTLSPKTKAQYGGVAKVAPDKILAAPFQAYELSNLVIGGKYEYRPDQMFQARYSSPMSSFRWYTINNSPGYSGGTGGTIVVSLYDDNGGNPGSVLAVFDEMSDLQFPKPSSGKGYFPLYVLSSPIELKAGSWYHIVFQNLDPYPDENFASIDYLRDDKVLNQLPDMKVKQWNNSSKVWTLLPQFVSSPFQIYYADGQKQGYGYIDAPSGVLEFGGEYGFLP